MSSTRAFPDDNYIRLCMDCGLGVETQKGIGVRGVLGNLIRTSAIFPFGRGQAKVYGGELAVKVFGFWTCGGVLGA